MKVTEDDADGDFIAEDAVAQQKRHSQLQSTQNTTRYYKAFCLWWVGAGGKEQTRNGRGLKRFSKPLTRDQVLYVSSMSY